MFIIAGIIMLGLAGGIFFLTKYTATKDLETEIPSQLPIASISSFTQSCIERIAKEAVAQNGVQGGYFEPPPEYVEVANLKIPYFYDGKNDATPPSRTLQKELAKNVQRNLNNCLQDFSFIKDQGYTVETGPIQSDIIFGDSIFFDFTFPVTISAETTSKTIDTFSTRVNVNIPKIIDTYEQIIEQQKIKPNFVMVSYLNDLALEKEVRIELNYIDGDSVLYTIIDQDSLIDEHPYQFTFAIKYDWTKEGK